MNIGKLTLICLAVAMASCTNQDGEVEVTSADTTDQRTIPDQDRPDVRSPDIGTETDIQFLTWKNDNALQRQARLKGRLSSQNGCLVVEAGTQTILVVLDEDRTNWNGSTQILVSETGAEYALGDTIELVGGYITEIPEKTSKMAEDCVKDAIFAGQIQ